MVNFCSGSARVAATGRWLYPATKAAILQVTRSEAIDLAPDRVEAATALLERGMRLTAMIQDGELQLMSEHLNVAMTPQVRRAATRGA